MATPYEGFDLAASLSNLASPSPQFLGGLAAIIPAVAYPFMPAGHIMACEYAVCLAYIPSLFLHCANTRFWVLGYPYVEYPLWIFPLIQFTLFVAVGRLSARLSSGSETTLGHFSGFARITFWVVLYTVFRYAISLIDTMSILSLTNATLGLFCAVVLPTYAFAIYHQFIHSASGIYFGLATRCLRPWFWLHAGETGQPFQPIWSRAIWIFVVVSAPVLTYLQVLAFRKETTLDILGYEAWGGRINNS